MSQRLSAYEEEQTLAVKLPESFFSSWTAISPKNLRRLLEKRGEAKTPDLSTLNIFQKQSYLRTFQSEPQVENRQARELGNARSQFLALPGGVPQFAVPHPNPSQTVVERARLFRAHSTYGSLSMEAVEEYSSANSTGSEKSGEESKRDLGVAAPLLGISKKRRRFPIASLKGNWSPEDDAKLKE